MADITCLIVGTKHRGPDAVAHLAQMKPGETVILRRDPQNQFDRHAIKVIALKPGGEQVDIGFIAKAHNRAIAMPMDASNAAERTATFGYAGTGASRVPAVKVTIEEN